MIIIHILTEKESLNNWVVIYLQRVSIAEFRLVSLYSLYILCVPDLELYLIHMPKFFTYVLFFSEIWHLIIW